MADFTFKPAGAAMAAIVAGLAAPAGVEAAAPVKQDHAAELAAAAAKFPAAVPLGEAPAPLKQRGLFE